MKLQLSNVLFALLIVLIVISGVIGYLAGSQNTATTYRETLTLTATVTTPITYTTTLVKTATVTETATPTPPKDTFTLTSWNTTVYHAVPCLYVTFRTKATVMLKLIGPDGAGKDSKIVSPEESGAYLYIAGFCETPSVGTYKLVVSTLFGTVFERNLTFNGYSVEVKSSKVRKSWNDFSQGTINGVELIISNNGDMPTYLKEIRLSIAGREDTAYADKWLVVGEVNVNVMPLLIGIPPGKHEMKIELLNDKDNLLDRKIVEVTFP